MTTSNNTVIESLASFKISTALFEDVMLSLYNLKNTNTFNELVSAIENFKEHNETPILNRRVRMVNDTMRHLVSNTEAEIKRLTEAS